MKNYLEETFNDIQKIKSVSGNDRYDVLRDILNHDTTQQTIFILVDKFTVTNISTKKINKKVSVNNYTEINTFSEFLYYIKNNVKGDDVSINTIQHYINSTDEKYHDFLVKISTKTLSIGVQISSYNKIAKELSLPIAKDFKVQLATGLNNIKNFEPEEDFYVTEKLDGIRCISILDFNHKTVKFFARSGKPIEGLTEIENELAQMFDADIDFDSVLDGELLSFEQADKAEDTFRDTAGKVGSKGEKTGLVFNVFDSITYKEFTGKQTSLTYSKRRDDLSALEEMITGDDRLYDMPHVSVLPVLYKGQDINQVYSLLDTYVANGSEGLMINLDKPYSLKRTKDLIKVKQSYESDGIIKGFYEGKGEFEGTLGGVYITYKDIVVKVGSGFKLEERNEIWANQEEYIGKIGSYKFTTESNDNDGNLKDLRFARWIRLRDDKTEVSYDN